MRDKGIVLVVVLLLVLAGWRFYQYQRSGEILVETTNESASTTQETISQNESGDGSNEPLLSGDGIQIIGSTTEEQNISATTNNGVPFLLTGIQSGERVTISGMNFDDAYWIAVHANANGQPGNVLGARMFPKGTTSGVVELAVAMKKGNTYFAVLHRDAGSRTWTNDNPAVKNSDGAFVGVKFIAE